LLHGYQLHLPTYEGPLDILLRLIESQQLPISDVSLVAVLDQFLAYVDARMAPEPGEIAEFAAIAGRLMVLKSRELLPRPAPANEEDEPSDLVRQLEEYRAIKLASTALAATHGLGGYGRGASIEHPPPAPTTMRPESSRVLLRALRRWLSRAPASPVTVTTRHATTLREMLSRVFTLLEGSATANFSAFVARVPHRQDRALAFLALLTLIRRQAVEAAQPDLFGEITFSRPGPGRGENGLAHAGTPSHGD
ncbi:MAG: segregation/condensation protein A, partial [Thermomicrobiales bacterium]|nr:segregation/condensation protein A [Thermomicrobiales bacterium]